MGAAGGLGSPGGAASYRPEPGQPVYEIRAGAHVALVAAPDLVGLLRELVMAVVAEGWDGG